MRSFALAPLAAACLCLSAHAEPAESLDKVVVTGNPLKSQVLAQPSDSLGGDQLVLTRAANLGDTLQGLAGVAATNFGPNASRPSIRGLDGDRVRILNNSGASVDASNLSFDHGVAIDPLVIDKVEVLRGAAALLYGGNAVGGVVNTLDNRIPRTLINGLSGAAEVRLGGASRDKSGAVVLDGGSGQAHSGFGWHVDLAGRDADDQRTPRFDSAGESRSSVRNSAARSHGGAVGGSVFFQGGYAGVSVDDFHTNYGTTAEEDVTIRMQRQRLATAGEWATADGPVHRISWQASRNRYEHVEMEGSEVGTTFKSTGTDGRVEVEHAAVPTPLGPVKGLIGLQTESLDFSALGEEAFVPSTRTRNTGVFLLEQARLAGVDWSAGARTERVTVDSDGGERFGAAASRRFRPVSLALSGVYPLSAAWSLSANLNRTQRAPAYYELFANGLHVASAAYERGDANLGLERSKGADLGLKWEGDGSHVHVNVYETRFANYIALQATGETVDNDGETLPVYAFQAVPARLRGVEFEGRWQVHPAVAFLSQLDAVRGDNRDTGEPLPRLAPLRAMLGLEAKQGDWSGRLEWRGAARQTRVAQFDTPTPGYGTLRLSLARQLRWGQTDALWYLKLDNLGNKLAYNATAVPTIRDLAPQAGRSASTGLQLRF
jgi:iron complex outermembrane recepter protein